MIKAAVTVYLLLKVVYLTLGENTPIWWAYDCCMALLSIAVFMHFSKAYHRVTKTDRFVLDFGIGITLAQLLYTIPCIFLPKDVVDENTNVFAIIITILFLLYLFLSYKSKK